VVDLIERSQAIIRFNLPSERELKIVHKALKPEAETSPSSRSKVQVKLEGLILTLIFEAKDTTALRAAINSYLRWIALIDDVYSLLESMKNRLQ